MKKNKKKLFWALLLIVALSVPVDMAFAYFTDYEDARGGAILTLSGETEIVEEADDAGKTIRIRNTGETNAIVRVRVFGDYITETAEDGWSKGTDGFWYYTKILMPKGAKAPEGEEQYYQSYETANIRAEIVTADAEAAAHDFDIVVVQEAQRVSFDGTVSNTVVKPADWQYPDISIGGFEEVN